MQRTVSVERSISAAPIREIEKSLVDSRPFGNDRSITDEFAASFIRRLLVLGQSVPAAGSLADALNGAAENRRIELLGDTVLRCAIQHAHRQVLTGKAYGLKLDDCEALFLGALGHLREGMPGTPLSYSVKEPQKLGDPDSCWIWTDDHPNDTYGQAFRYLIQQNYNALPVTGSAAEVAALRTGARLLNELVPQLGPATLQHTHLLALIPSSGDWAHSASSSQFKVSGVIFLNHRLLENPWW